MYCTHCGKQVTQDMAYCSACGGSQPGAPSRHKLMRPLYGRKIAGVCLGVANNLNVDVTLVRVIWVLASLLPPSPGVLCYIICWIIFPVEEVMVSPAPAPAPQAQTASQQTS